MDSKFSLTFNPSGKCLVLRGRLASKLLNLDLELLRLVYVDPYKSCSLCPEYFVSVRSERFLSRFFSLSAETQSICIYFYETVLLKSPDLIDLSQRDFYILLLSQDLDISCRCISSKSQFVVCFLYAYYALKLKCYNPDFDFETLPF